MTLANALGTPRVHYCREHNEEVKTYRVWPKKAMRYFCKEGCKLSKNETVLKVKEIKSRWK